MVTVTETVGKEMLMDPPLEDALIGLPVGSEATGLVIVICVVAFTGEAAIVTVAVATTPLDIVVLFRPATMQVIDPVPVPQETDFPAAVAEGPAAHVIEAMSAVEYPTVHCRDDGKSGPVELRDRLSTTVDPGLPEPEAKLRFVWPEAA